MTHRELERGVAGAAAAGARPCSPSWPCAAATPTPRTGSPSSRCRPIGPATCSGSLPVLELETEWALTSGAPMPAERFEQLVDDFRPLGGLTGWAACRVAAWAAVAGTSSSTRGSRPRRRSMRWCGVTGQPRPTRSATRAGTHDRALMLSLLDDEERARGGARGRARARRRAADEAGRGTDARARPERPARAARVDPREPGGPDRAPARGARADRGRAHERGDRRAARRLAADGRAPRRRRADEARRHDPARRRPPRRGARLAHAELRPGGGLERATPRGSAEPRAGLSLARGAARARGRVGARSPRRATRPRAGEGRVVFVTGEPGIGKTSLVTRFVRDLGPDARVLFGTCDDLSIPRPLGPIHDLIGTVSVPLEQALSAGAASHEVHSLLIAELELPPQPTVLVLEDVHWADDATLDAITVLGRRIGSLPALLVLTYRPGEARASAPRRARRDPRRRRGLPRARARCRSARSPRSRARTRTRCTRRPRATRSSSPSC